MGHSALMIASTVYMGILYYKSNSWDSWHICKCSPYIILFNLYISYMAKTFYYTYFTNNKTETERPRTQPKPWGICNQPWKAQAVICQMTLNLLRIKRGLILWREFSGGTVLGLSYFSPKTMARDSMGQFGKLWEESLTSVALGLDVAHSRKSKGCDSKSSGSQPAGCVCFDTHLLSPVARTVTVYLLQLNCGSYGRRKSVCVVCQMC